MTLIGLNYREEKNDVLRGCPLNGCLNDTRSLYPKYRSLIERINPNIKIDKVLLHDTSNKSELLDFDDVETRRGTKIGILNRLSELALKSESNPSKRYFHMIHYSGHGYHSVTSDKNEDDGRDECIIPSNVGRTSGAEAVETLKDNELREAISKFGENCVIFIVFDCCFSGTVIDARFNYTLNRNRTKISLSNYPYVGDGIVSRKAFRARVYSISSAQDDTVSAEIGGNGILTIHMNNIWNSGKLTTTTINSFIAGFSNYIVQNRISSNQKCGMEFENLFSDIPESMTTAVENATRLTNFCPYDFVSIF
jgi:hypothetical protein